MTEEVKQLAEAIIPEEFKKAKFFAVMIFYQGSEIGLPNEDAWVNVNNLVFQDHSAALNAYANIPCPASQLVEADTRAGLLEKIKEMQRNYHDKDWLDKNLYPYL